MSKVQVSLTDIAYWANHSVEALDSIIERYTGQSLAMAFSSPALSAEAMSIANAAWAAKVSR